MIPPDPLQAEAQQALDELLKEGALPFKLQAREIREEVVDHYVVYFHDSRLRTVTVNWQPGDSFKDQVRAAVLRKVASLNNLTMED